MAKVYSYQTREEFISDIDNHKNEEVYIGNIDSGETKEELVVVHGKDNGNVPFFIENTGSNDVTIFIRNISTNEYLPKIQKADNVYGPWSDIDEKGFIIKPNKKVYIIGSNLEGFSKSKDNYNYFSCEDSGASLNLGGNLATLFIKSGYDSVKVPDYCFYGLFMGLSSSTLTLDETFKLSSKEVGNYSYAKLFNGCKNLVSIPGNLLNNEESSVGKFSYFEMFRECSKLKIRNNEVFELPAKIIPEGAYKSMFYRTAVTDIAKMGCEEVGPHSLMQMYAECSGITNVTQILPAKTLGKNCYDSFFLNCKNLTTVPTDPIDFLPATTLAPYCYKSLFENTKVKNVKLNATTLAEGCYYYLFKDNKGSWDKRLILPAEKMVSKCYERLLYEHNIPNIEVEIWTTNAISTDYAKYFGFYDTVGILHLRSNYVEDYRGYIQNGAYLNNWEVKYDL